MSAKVYAVAVDNVVQLFGQWGKDSAVEADTVRAQCNLTRSTEIRDRDLDAARRVTDQLRAVVSWWV